MKERPFFSIVIPTFNRVKDLRFAIYCLRRQNFKDFEIIISDNFSTDETKKMVLSIKDNRIRYFRNKSNIDFSLNVKEVMGHASGKYILLHSDDDFFLDVGALYKIHKKIIKNSPGFVRVNYTCLSPDEKKIFNFKVNKPFENDYYFNANRSSEDVFSFILNSDPFFMTGLIIKNDLSKNVQVVYADPAPWIDLLYYSTKKFGGLFLKNQFIIAHWSQWRNDSVGHHPLYSLKKGKLKSENFFEIVKSKVKDEYYQEFLRNQLMFHFVTLFPVIKIMVGNENIHQIAKRVMVLDPKIKFSMKFCIYYFLTIFTPTTVLRFLRKCILNIYITMYELKDARMIIKKIKILRSNVDI